MQSFDVSHRGDGVVVLESDNEGRNMQTWLSITTAVLILGDSCSAGCTGICGFLALRKDFQPPQLQAVGV